VDLSATGTGEYNSRHLYIIKFRIGITYSQVLEDIKREPFVRSVFTEVIFESHIAEIDGKIAMLAALNSPGGPTEISRRRKPPEQQARAFSPGGSALRQTRRRRTALPERVVLARAHLAQTPLGD
jgi:hypothetical protein